MSPHICNAKHFNSIELAINYLAQDNQFSFPYSFKDKFPELYNHTKISTEGIEHCVSTLIDTLRSLNVLCTMLRDKNDYEGILDNEIEEQMEILMLDKRSSKNLTRFGLYKALQCLNYQIEINHLKELRNLSNEEESALFFLEEMINHLAHTIIRELPEYHLEDWRIY
ncbi:MAG: hypothetical protein WBP45_14920 [Daejeonella sp.]